MGYQRNIWSICYEEFISCQIQIELWRRRILCPLQILRHAEEHIYHHDVRNGHSSSLPDCCHDNNNNLGRWENHVCLYCQATTSNGWLHDKLHYFDSQVFTNFASDQWFLDAFKPTDFRQQMVIHPYGYGTNEITPQNRAQYQPFNSTVSPRNWCYLHLCCVKLVPWSAQGIGIYYAEVRDDCWWGLA